MSAAAKYDNVWELHAAADAACAAADDADNNARDARDDRVILRPYQQEAVERIHTELAVNRSTLLVMATGTGKTTVFGEVARLWPGKVLVLAHREELLGQAKERIENMTGENCDIEQAEFHAGWKTRLVVGSIQSLSRLPRLQGFDRDHFGLIIVDEAHHTPATSYKRLLDYFCDAKVLGVTATPDRGDKKALGRHFDSVAYTFDIEAGIAGGYLSPITARRVFVDSIHLEAARTVAGDFNQGDLDAVMSTEENIHAVVKPCIELCAERPTIVFTTGVETAKRMAEVFCRYRADSARSVDGKTESDERKRTINGFLQRKFQFLINVGIATEGFDAPQTSCIVIARPTKSRALYAQMAGRGLRVAAGKNDCLLLDLAGNSGRHSLVSAADILGGSYTDEEVKRAKVIIADGGEVDVQDALDQAHEEAQAAEIERAKRAALDAAKRAKAQAKVAYRVQRFSPFSVIDIADPGQVSPGAFGSGPVSMEQLNTLAKFRVPGVAAGGMDKRQCDAFIAGLRGRASAGLCTYRQAKELQRRGVDTSKMSFVRANMIMTALARNNMHNLPLSQMMALTEGRIPGEDDGQ